MPHSSDPANGSFSLHCVTKTVICLSSPKTEQQVCVIRWVHSTNPVLRLARYSRALKKHSKLSTTYTYDYKCFFQRCFFLVLGILLLWSTKVFVLLFSKWPNVVCHVTLATVFQYPHLTYMNLSSFHCCQKCFFDHLNTVKIMVAGSQWTAGIMEI